MIALLNPKMLMGLLLLALVWLLAARMHSSPRWRLVAILRSLVIGCVVLALARPALRLTTDRLTHVVVVDTSASVSDADRADARRMIASLEAQRRPHDQLYVVAVDNTARRVAIASDGKCELPRAQGGGSRLALGLAAAAALLEASGNGRVTLISDGLETDQQLQLAARQLASAGVPVDTVPTKSSAASVMMTGLTAPAFFTAGEKIVLHAELQATKAMSGAAVLLRDGKQVATKNVNIQPGANHMEFEITAKQPISARYEVRFRSDQVTANIVAPLVPPAALRVLLVETDVKRGAALRDAMAREGIEVVVRSPSAGFADLNRFSAVLLGDVAAKELGAPNHLALRNYVERDGGGLMMLGGERSYGAGGYQKTPIAELLPIEFEQERQEQDPSVALAILLDTSGSMQGMRLQLAKEVAVRAIRHLTPQDRIGVVEFYGSRRWAVPMQRAADLASVELVLERLRAAGGTVLYGALEEAYYTLVNVRARYKHVLIISDGDVFPGPFNQLASRMATEGITVSTVKVAPEGASNFLQDVAFHGRGRSFDYSGITVPDINFKQMSRVPQSPFRENPFKPVAAKRQVELLKGVNLEQAPPLLGYVTVRPHPKAELVLKTPTGEPLLARWQFGLGKTIAFTSDARDRWASAWLKWPGFGKFWSQVIRDLARDTSLPLRVTTSSDDRETRLRLEPQTGVGEVQAQVYSAAAPPQAAKLTSLSPSIYELRLPHGDAEATRTVVVRARTTDGLERSTTVQIPSLRLSEFRLLEPDTDLLKAVSQVTGGIFRPSLQELTRPAPAKVVWLEIWHWLLAFGATTLLVEVLVRRLP